MESIRAEPEIGDEAPDFDLPSHLGGNIRLSDYRGKNSVLLIFYPGDATPICTKQICSYNSAYDEFKNRGYELLGISVDSPDKHREWAAEKKLTFPLLSDMSRKVCQSYGVLGAILKIPKRALFLVDKQGIVRYKHVEATRLLFRKADAILEVLERGRI